jgi:hypothetical protein
MTWNQAAELEPDWTRADEPLQPWAKTDPGATYAIWDEGRSFWDVLPGQLQSVWDFYVYRPEIWVKHE